MRTGKSTLIALVAYTLILVAFVLLEVVPVFRNRFDHSSFGCSTVTEIPVVECEALVTLFNSTRRTISHTSSTWLRTDTPCQWDGVACADGHVVQLRLPIGGLAARPQLWGEIPPELGNLAQLENLDLRDNQLTGNIPPELGNLVQLEFLGLSDNQLTGNIPPELGNLAQLEVLGLGSNQLTGNIPPELGHLAQLEDLDLDNNQLTGNIPPELGHLAQLEDLNLDNNQLTGNIPPELCRPNVEISVSNTGIGPCR